MLLQIFPADKCFLARYPMENTMNLRPIFALAAIGWLLAGPAFAGVRDDVITGAVRCAQIPDDRQWLDCYYGAAQPMRSQLGLPPAPQAQTKLFTSTEFAIPQTESRSSSSTRKATLDARMVAFSFDHNGIYTATLSNGQVWRQLSGDTTQAHWSKPPGAVIYKVEIS